jgi:hypothetical protein
MIELSSKGYRKHEPSPITQRESSKLLPMVFRALKDDGISRDDIAKDLNVFVSDIDSLLFNLAMVGVNGGKSSSAELTKNKNLSKIVRVK